MHRWDEWGVMARQVVTSNGNEDGVICYQHMRARDEMRAAVSHVHSDACDVTDGGSRVE